MPIYAGKSMQYMHFAKTVSIASYVAITENLHAYQSKHILETTLKAEYE